MSDDAKQEKRYSFVFIKNPDNVTSPGKKGHKFGLFKAPPEVWYIEGLPDLQGWLSNLHLSMTLAAAKGSSGLMLKIGGVKLHHKDTFVRKEGTRLAKERAASEAFDITRFTLKPHGTLADNAPLFDISLESDNYLVYLNVYQSGKPSIYNIRRKKNAKN